MLDHFAAPYVTICVTDDNAVMTETMKRRLP